MMNYVIGVSGESGVVKSTITKVIQLFYGVDNTTVISSDDLHKWERSSDNWNKMTHLNPDANNLDLGDDHLEALSKGNYIHRSVYNHKSGAFNPPIKINPKSIIINHGLHAFYTKKSQEYTNLKIFINTDDSLRTHWKIIRDTEKRGYKYNDVLDSIIKRRADAQVINQEQLRVADVIVEIRPERPIKKLGDRNEVVEVIVDNILINNTENDLFVFLKEYNSSVKNFVRICNNVGSRIEDSQAAGGNASIKIQDKMVIKASGHTMGSISHSEGYVTIDYNQISNVENEEDYNRVLKSTQDTSSKRPSMEAGFHAILGKCVLHSHPIYLTSILCMKDSEDKLKELYGHLDYVYIPYRNPGFDLFNAIKNLDRTFNVYFLENHGLIINSENSVELEDKFRHINDIAKKYITEKFKTFDLGFANGNQENQFMFPDAVVFNDNLEIIAANNYINYVTKNNGRFLSKKDIIYLLMMESEKFRKNL